MAKPAQLVKKPVVRRAPPVRAPIPFRDRVDLYDGVKMRKIGPQEEGTSVLQSYLNVVPEQKALVNDVKKTSSSTRTSSSKSKGGGAASTKNNWLSNLNVYIDPTSANSFLHNPGKSGKGCGKKEEIKWTARDDPGLWREFLIVLLMISIMITACFGLMQYVLKHDPPPTPTTAP